MKTYSYLLLTFLLLSCTKDSPVNNNINCNHLGTPFILKVNECTTLTPFVESNKDDSTITVCFKEILTDGRCFQSDCSQCYGSNADISISLIYHSDTTNLTLTILGCNSNSEPVCDEDYFYRKDTLGYRVCFLQLNPYPDYDNTPINPSDYSAKFKITKL